MEDSFFNEINSFIASEKKYLVSFNHTKKSCRVLLMVGLFIFSGYLVYVFFGSDLVPQRYIIGCGLFFAAVVFLYFAGVNYVSMYKHHHSHMAEKKLLAESYLQKIEELKRAPYSYQYGSEYLDGWIKKIKNV